MLGKDAPPAARAIAGSAFTALVPHHDDRLLQFALALVTYLGQLGVGLASIISPRTEGYVEALPPRHSGRVTGRA